MSDMTTEIKGNIFTFPTTGEAYDGCMCGIPEYDDDLNGDKEIKCGDILMIPSEKVIGVCDTWPIAVTKEHGQLHLLKEGVTFDHAGLDDEVVKGLHEALVIAQAKGWV